MILGFCIVSAVVCKVSEKGGGEIKVIIVIAACGVVFLKIIGFITDISDEVKDLFIQADIDQQYLKILFKGLGICYVTQLACDFCKDCGENSLAGQAELAGKISLLIISLPLFNALIEIIKTLLV